MHKIRRPAGRAAPLGVVLVTAFLSVATPGTGALAASCPSLLRASGSPEIARLQRQIAANRAFEAKYRCAAQSTFACREIAGRIAQANARITSLSGAPDRNCEKPLTAERTSPRRRAAVPSTTVASSLPRNNARMEMRCVRLEDGYHFPTPNSGYNTAKDIGAVAAQCKFICDDPAMDVYRIVSPDRNTDDMISATTGARYAELPNAGAYRVASPLKTCDMNRFYKTVLAKAPATGASQSETTANEQITGEPAVMNVALLGNVGLRGTTSVVPAPARKVRIVGAAFLPDE